MRFIWYENKAFFPLIANVITDSVGHILLLFIWLGSPVYRWYLMDQHGTIGKCGQMKSFLISDLCGIFSVSRSEHPCVSRAGSGQLKKLLWRRWRRWFPMVGFFFGSEKGHQRLCVWRHKLYSSASSSTTEGAFRSAVCCPLWWKLEWECVLPDKHCWIRALLLVYFFLVDLHHFQN